MTNKPDFSTMSLEQLREYFLQNRHDNEAFYAYMDKVYAAPSTKVQSMEHFVQLVEERLRQKKEKSEE